MERITSKDNPRIKRARALERKRERLRSGEFLVEGVRLVEEAVRRRAPLVEAFISPAVEQDARGRLLVSELMGQSVPVLPVTESVLTSISQTETPQGVVAISRFAEMPIVSSNAPLYLVLDGVRDPGNVGTILRTAQAAGVDAVFCLKGTADPWQPKVVRAAMGAHFSLPIKMLETVDEFPQTEQVFTAEAAKGVPYFKAEWHRSTALVVGGEAFGPSEEAKQKATGSVSIPMQREVESLNVAIATGVLLFEAFKQRHG